MLIGGVIKSKDNLDHNSEVDACESGGTCFQVLGSI